MYFDLTKGSSVVDILYRVHNIYNLKAFNATQRSVSYAHKTKSHRLYQEPNMLIESFVFFFLHIMNFTLSLYCAIFSRFLCAL